MYRKVRKEAIPLSHRFLSVPPLMGRDRELAFLENYLDAAKDGLQAIIDAAYPGKTIIFPHIKSLPLTSIVDLKGVAPKAYAKLKNGREWTKEAEKAFLETMLE